MISIINNPNSVVAYFWQEDYDQVIANGSGKRAVEKDGVRKLLQELGYGEFETGYKATGQPYFKQRPELFLSVSHAKGWFAVNVGSKPVGIDIQPFSSRLKQGQDYFRNEQELPFADDERALHLIWGAKEAFYKLMEGQIPDLKKDVSVIDILKETLCVDFGSEKYNLGYKIFDEVYLVFTI